MRPGWCTNVLPTRCAEELAAAVETMGTCIPESAPVGLWLPDHVLGDDPAAAVAPIAATLRRIGTPLLGLNTFPQGDFHQNRVKDAVYQPAWGDQCRLDYTLRAAEAVIALTQPGDEIGLTTVPIGWPSHAIDLDAARSMLCTACEELDLLSERSDRTIFLAVEPEPRFKTPLHVAPCERVWTPAISRWNMNRPMRPSPPFTMRRSASAVCRSHRLPRQARRLPLQPCSRLMKNGGCIRRLCWSAMH